MNKEKVCTKLGYVNSDENYVSISLTDPFFSKNYYYILFAYEFNYETITAVSGTFGVQDKCQCERDIEILSTVEECYSPKDV